METSHNNKKKNNDEILDKSNSVIKDSSTANKSIPEDLIDDLKNKKIDPLTEGSTHLGYEERAPRKKELEQDEHYDQDDK